MWATFSTELALSPHVCMGFVWVLWFPPTTQRHEHEVDWHGYTVPVCASVGVGVVCPVSEGPGLGVWRPQLPGEALATCDPELE